MSPLGHVPARYLAGLLLASSLSACDRTTADERKQTPVEASPRASSAPLADTAPIAFERIDPRSIPFRGVPTGTEGRFSGRAAILASPCGFHLVISEKESSWTALLVGHELSWSEESAPPLLRLDGLTLDVGIIDARAMGAVADLGPDALLDLTGQWESTWLRREAESGPVPVKENARGTAHLEPHPAWRVWSATLGPGHLSTGMPTSHAVVGTVALGQRVLVLRALLADDKLALRALRRLVFAVDSIEQRPGAISRSEFTKTLEQAAKADPTCAGVHDAHDAQLE